MKAKWLAVALLVVAGQARAQVGELQDAVVIEKTALSDPAEAVSAAEGHWMAFSVPAQAGTRSPCCWKGRWNGVGEAGCSLEPEHQSYGTRSDSPLATELIVYSEIRQGRVHKMRLVGKQCPVDGDGAQVSWIGTVDDSAGLDWLESQARSDADSAGDTALYALALHGSPDASRRLHDLVLTADGDQSEEAIFWLGEARGEDGFKVLKKLLSELPEGDRRRAINFALSQSSTTEAADLLFEISKSDPDPQQRGGALFWLAEEYPEQAKGWLLEVINTEQDEDVLEQAVFAISPLPGEVGSQMLLDLARNNETPRNVRRQALFWLAQSDDDKAVAALTDLLTR
jgi:hypothetical protein